MLSHSWGILTRAINFPFASAPSRLLWKGGGIARHLDCEAGVQRGGALLRDHATRGASLKDGDPPSSFE
jgi:hypothetical protein